MKFPLVVGDFLDRAEHVYPNRVAVVDEPDQPAPSLGSLPQFHANGWGMPFAMTGVGAQHVILRKVDGTDVTAEQLITRCRESLAGYKCPKRIEFVTELPRTATGKLQKFKLREQFWAGRDRQVS